MALTYRLKFIKKLVETEQLKKLIKDNDSKFFIISVLYSSNRGYLESLFMDTLIIRELENSSIISIDIIDKEANQIELRKSILEVVRKITIEIYPNEDYYFDFNGDIIHEMRENGVVKRNSKSGFYNEIE
jgi:hypothetical protein